MAAPAEIVYYALAAIMACVACTWAWIISYIVRSRRRTPRLGSPIYENAAHPKVSVILPARNEEAYIGRCLDSLIKQDYPNYEIIAIDDSSDDDTGRIIKEYAGMDARVVHVAARPKPEGWMGKNWACMEGYGRATGELLLFTDSDTHHAGSIISLAVARLASEKLDALTIIPRMLCMEFWTRVTLPVISMFLHTQFSALKVNDPAKSTGYFFGSFFIIRAATYDSVGTHEGVRGEIIEDGALGRKVKEAGHKMRMIQGDHLVEAVWARDGPTLWHALKRLMVPLYTWNKSTAVGIFLAVMFLLPAPFALLGLAAAVQSPALLGASLAASILVYAGTILETGILRIRARYALFAPVGAAVIALGFLAGMVCAGGSSAVSWRGRKYSMKGYAQRPIRI